MYYYIYAEKDATIYSEVQGDKYKKNTGLDEILELEKKVPPVNDTIENSRILLKFDITEVSNSMVSGMIPLYHASHEKSSSVSMKLYTARPSEIPLSYQIYTNPISGSWDMGIGKKYYSPIIKDGVSWKYKTSETVGDEWPTSSFAASTSASNWSGSSMGGGTWYTSVGMGMANSLRSSQSYEYESADIDINVGPTYNVWYVQTIPNEGFIIRRKESEESSSANYGKLTFFSRDTHTIYPPRMEFKWDDSVWETTASISEVDIKTDPVVYMKGRGSVYKETSKRKFRVYARRQYKNNSPAVGVTTNQMFTEYYLPTSSYYSIKDTVTEETIIPFSDESKLSADDTSCYFNLWMNGLQPERYYRVLIKAVSGSGTSEEMVHYYDDNFTFKVER